VLGLNQFAWLRGVGVGRDVIRLETLRSKHIWRGEYRLAAQCTDAGLVKHGVLGLHLRCMPRLLGSFQLDPTHTRIGVIDLRHCLIQALAVIRRQPIQQ